MASSRRDHLVNTALHLFMRDGYHATGIDGILAAAGVAKMTLYNHFKSKDELILAALRLRDERFRQGLVKRVEARADNPRGRLLAVFGAIDEWINQADFNGCVFMNAAAEYGQADNPIHQAAAEHKQQVRNYIRQLAVDAGASDPDALSDTLDILLEGAVVTASVSGRKDAAKVARRAATILIKRALDGGA